METFSHKFLANAATMEVALHRGFSNDHYESLVKFYQERVGKGVINWDVNLQQLEIINSIGLGVLVAFNAAVASRGGRLRLILKSDSKLSDLLRLTKLDRIINCMFL